MDAKYSRKCIGTSEGEFYIGGFAVLKFIEPVTRQLNGFQHYKTAYRSYIQWQSLKVIGVSVSVRVLFAKAVKLLNFLTQLLLSWSVYIPMEAIFQPDFSNL